MNVLVAGGSGTIGLPLVRALVRAGHQVTSLSRSAARRRELTDLGVSIVQADVRNGGLRSKLCTIAVGRPDQRRFKCIYY